MINKELVDWLRNVDINTYSKKEIHDHLVGQGYGVTEVRDAMHFVYGGKKSHGKLSFGSAFRYPFNRAMGMLNILWMFVPIFGWFILTGYVTRIIKGFCNGEFERLPFLRVGEDMKTGFFMLLKPIGFFLVFGIVMVPLLFLGTILFGVTSFVVQVINFMIQVFVLPILLVNFMNKQTLESLFEFGLVGKVFANFGDYVVVLLKGVLLGLVFMIFSLVLVGIPAMVFTTYIFIADFYWRRC